MITKNKTNIMVLKESQTHHPLKLDYQTLAAALIMAGPPISMFSIPSSNTISLDEVTLS